MNKKVILLLFMISLIGIVSSCDNNNEFGSGENVDVCISNCSYRYSYISNYVQCDGNVSCFLYVTNSSGYIIANNVNMTRIGQSFNYSIGNASIYNATLIADYLCLFPYGKDEGRFLINANAPVSSSGGPGGGYGGGTTIINNTYLIEVEKNATEENNRIQRDIQNIMNTLQEKISPLYKGYGRLIIIIVLLILIFLPEIKTATNRFLFKGFSLGGKKKNG